MLYVFFVLVIRYHLKQPSEENPVSASMVLPTIDDDVFLVVEGVAVEGDQDDGDNDENVEPRLQSPVLKSK